MVGLLDSKGYAVAGPGFARSLAVAVGPVRPAIRRRRAVLAGRIQDFSLFLSQSPAGFLA